LRFPSLAVLLLILSGSPQQKPVFYFRIVIAEYTDVVAKWTMVPSIEAYLRTCAFNRGPVARQHYELSVAGHRDKFWKGRVNRWDNSLDFARDLA
jgi:hypothetical protein